MIRHPVSRGPLRSALASAILAACSGLAAAAPPADIHEVLARFDRVQNSIRTLSAEFTETTKSPLLKEPLVAEGVVYLTKPSSVRWEYSRPEEMRFVIANDEYTGYFPERKQAERRDVHRWAEQLFRFLGLGQASGELAKFYDIELAASSGAEPGTFQLVLDPRKKRVRKRMELVRFWIDETTFLPVKVAYEAKGGGTRTVEFRHVRVNPDLAASLYRMEVPPGIPIGKGFSALSGLNGSSN